MRKRTEKPADSNSSGPRKRRLWRFFSAVLLLMMVRGQVLPSTQRVWPGLSLPVRLVPEAPYPLDQYLQFSEFYSYPHSPNLQAQGHPWFPMGWRSRVKNSSRSVSCRRRPASVGRVGAERRGSADGRFSVSRLPAGASLPAGRAAGLPSSPVSRLPVPAPPLYAWLLGSVPCPGGGRADGDV